MEIILQKLQYLHLDSILLFLSDTYSFHFSKLLLTILLFNSIIVIVILKIECVL
jgi:hypothetical protein